MERKKVELYAGCTMESAYYKLKEVSCSENVIAYADFNGHEITSEDTEEEVCMKITGLTLEQKRQRDQEWLSAYKKRQHDFEVRIPALTKEYRERARGLILESKLQQWDDCVPIRLGDLYHGMELEQTLKICEIMRDETIDYGKRLRKAYDLFMDAGHSGMSAHLTAAMLREFCPYGSDIADAVLNFRFEKHDENKQANN